MARRRSSGGITASLLFLCAALAGVIYLEVNAELPLPPPPEAAGTVEPVASVEPPRPFALEPLADFAETVDRPLFMATRRPPVPGAVEPPPDEEAPAPPPVISGIALSGIVISPGERFALLQVVGSSELVKVGVGEEVLGWQIAAISPDRVVLRQREAVRELVLKDKEAPRAPLRPSRALQEKAPAPPLRGSRPPQLEGKAPEPPAGVPVQRQAPSPSANGPAQ